MGEYQKGFEVGLAAGSGGAVGSKPVAWRWMNTAHPDLGWNYTEQEVKESPSLLIKVEALYNTGTA